MHFERNAQRVPATGTSWQVPVVRIAAVAGTVGLLAISAPVIWIAVSAGIGLAALMAMALGGAVIFQFQVTARLAVYLGPIARIVTKKAVQNSANRAAFVRMVADNLGTQERVAFLREMGYAEK